MTTRLPSLRRAGVLGSPVSHSLSPVLHRAAYKELGLGAWTYGRFEVNEAALPRFMESLGTEWAGLSLTMPLKRAVIPLLDEISDTASCVQAVNTVVFADDGRRSGHNTDIPGMVAALAERGIEKVESAAILGAGATAASALAALSRICRNEVVAYVRSTARAAEMQRWAERLGVDLRTAPWGKAGQALHAPLVIATTPAGATDDLASVVPERPGALFDVLYDPWPTRLAASWSAHGGSVVGGLDLLVHQAALQIGQFTGRPEITLAEMRSAGLRSLRARWPEPTRSLAGHVHT